MTFSNIPPETIAAYTETVYRVFGDTAFEIIIGQSCESLGILYKKFGCNSSAFITAFNPKGVPISEAENTSAQLNLEERLRQSSIQVIDGIGVDSAGRWPSESSVLALGLSLDEAKYWGTEFQQNAIVWIPVDITPQLILLR